MLPDLRWYLRLGSQIGVAESEGEKEESTKGSICGVDEGRRWKRLFMKKIGLPTRVGG